MAKLHLASRGLIQVFYGCYNDSVFVPHLPPRRRPTPATVLNYPSNTLLRAVVVAPAVLFHLRAWNCVASSCRCCCCCWQRRPPALWQPSKNSGGGWCVPNQERLRVLPLWSQLSLLGQAHRFECSLTGWSVAARQIFLHQLG